MLCWKAEEDFDFLFWDCPYGQAVWSYFLSEFGVSYADHQGVRATIEEEQVFCGREKGHNEVCSLIRFHIYFWALISKTFCKYYIGNILLSWIHFF